MAEEKMRLRLVVPCVTCALLRGEDRSWSCCGMGAAGDAEGTLACGFAFLGEGDLCSDGKGLWQGWWLLLCRGWHMGPH